MIYGFGSFNIAGTEIDISDAQLDILVQSEQQSRITALDKVIRPWFTTRTGIEYILNINAAELDFTSRVGTLSKINGQDYITYTTGAPDGLAISSLEITPGLFLNYFTGYSAPFEPLFNAVTFTGAFYFTTNSILTLSADLILIQNSGTSLGGLTYSYSCLNPILNFS